MDKAKEVYIKYVDYKLQGSNSMEAIKEALIDVLGKESYGVHIYLDQYHDFSHVFIDGCVLFADGSIYKSIKSNQDDN